nr:hypothetical protein FVER53263_05788 [Fusarium verticillioides]
MAKPVMISVLECDNHIDPDRSKWGGYGPLVSKWLRSNDRLQELAQIRVWDVKNAMDYPEPGDYDVLIITGAPANPEGEEPCFTVLKHKNRFGLFENLFTEATALGGFPSSCTFQNLREHSRKSSDPTESLFMKELGRFLKLIRIV